MQDDGTTGAPELVAAAVSEQMETRTVVAEKAALRGKAHATLPEYLESLLVTVLLALFGTSFIVQAFKIPSSSMEGTLLVGDHLLVNKFIFGGTGAWYERFLPYRPLQRGDIIVFKYPYADHQHFVKRVIGLPGDRVKLVDQELYVNGKIVREPYVVHDPLARYDPMNYSFPPQPQLLIAGTFGEPPEITNWKREMKKYIQNGEIVVPPGKYFAMGDNRDNSLDSRFWGFVDREAIMGRPLFIYWSIEATSADYSGDSSFLKRVGGVLDTILHLPTRTRWSRMLRTVH